MRPEEPSTESDLDTLTFHDLARDDPIWGLAFPVLGELRPHLTREDLDRVLDEAAPEGLRFTACLRDELVVGLAGWRVMTTTYAYRKLHVDDLVVAAGRRSCGLGSALVRFLESRATELGCTVIDLDSRVHRHRAHRFYTRERFGISAHHFLRDISRSPEV